MTDFYRFDEVLGEGTFSIVYLAESKVEPDGWVAIKVIEKQAAMRILGKDLPGSGSMLEQVEHLYYPLVKVHESYFLKARGVHELSD